MSKLTAENMIKVMAALKSQGTYDKFLRQPFPPGTMPTAKHKLKRPRKGK